MVGPPQEETVEDFSFPPLDISSRGKEGGS